MNFLWRGAAAALLLIGSFGTQAQAADIKMLAPVALTTTFQDLKPMFEKASEVGGFAVGNALVEMATCAFIRLSQSEPRLLEQIERRLFLLVVQKGIASRPSWS